MRVSKELRGSSIVIYVLSFVFGLMVPASVIMFSTMVMFALVAGPLIALLLFGDMILGLVAGSLIDRAATKDDAKTVLETDNKGSETNWFIAALSFLTGTAVSLIGLIGG